MDLRPTNVTGVIVLLVLSANLAMMLFIFPLSSLATFALAGLIFGFAARMRSVYDPVCHIWEFTPLSAAAFDSWAHHICDAQSRARLMERFLKSHELTPGMKWRIAVSRVGAYLYMHALVPLVLLPSALLVYQFYLVVGGHTVVWTDPKSTGAVMGAVWGFCVGLFVAWRTSLRIRRQSEAESVITVKST